MTVSKSTTKRGGFTLVEVLVASFITVILLMMLFRVLFGAMNAWQSGSSRLQTNSDARLALDMIARDLQSMVVRQTSYDQEWLYAGPETLSNVPYGVAINNTWLMFFAPSLDRPSGQEGDIVALSYRSEFQDPLSDSNLFNTFGLYKSMIDTTNTFASFLGSSNILNGDSAVPGSLGWKDMDGETVYHYGSTDRANFLIPNVMDFQVAWWVRDNSASSNLHHVPATNRIRLRNGLWVSQPIPSSLVPYKVGTAVNGFVQVNASIEAADLTMTILDNEGAQRLRLIKEDSQINALRREHGHVYSQRVEIEY